MKIRGVAAAIASIMGVAAVAWLDHATGNEIRIFPFYFLPLAFIAWHFGRGWAIAGSLMVSIIWAATLYLGGREYSSALIWLINIFTQAFAFLVITFLVAAMRKAYQREKATSRIDPLTGLPNRRAFEEESERLLAMCRRHEWPVTIAYVDLDNFKHVNDTRGHDAGDRVLKRTAETFESRLRHSDVAARIGGDEFAILLPETDAATAESTLETLRRSLASLPEFAAYKVSASIGARSFAVAPRHLDSLVKAADEVMYQAKSAGKNRVRVESDPVEPVHLKQTS